jgi:hypothetical protein
MKFYGRMENGIETGDGCSARIDAYKWGIREFQGAYLTISGNLSQQTAPDA